MLAQEKRDLLAQRLAAIKTFTVSPPSIPEAAPTRLAERRDGLALDGITMLQSLSGDERARLAKQCIAHKVAPGTVIAEQFSVGSSVFFLIEGIARIMHNPGQDGEVTIATVRAGNALGEIAAIDGQGRTAAIVAETECVVMELASEHFNALLGTHAQIARDLLRRWATVIRQLDEKVSTLANGGPEQRVYGELLRLAKTTAEGGDRWIIAEMPSHREIAMWAHASRDVVVKILAELVRDGIVERRLKTLHIHNYDVLRQRAAGAEGPLAADERPAA